MLFLYRHVFEGNPREATLVDDSPEAWGRLLDKPSFAADEEAKERAAVLCGAKYFDDAESREKENIESVRWLVLDVDNVAKVSDFEAGPGRVPNEDELRAALKGTRAIVYTSPRHTAQNPRWRVLIPLASPLPPKKHRALVSFLSRGLVPGFTGCIDVNQTGDPGRLGFVGVTMEPAHYKWFTVEGAPFDWTQIPLEDEVWTLAPLGGLDRQPHWTDRDTAFQQALKYYGSQTFDRSRGHRTIILWQIAMELWWQWAAEDEDFVMDVLRHVNLQFWEQKPEDLLFRRMREAHKRTVGDTRKEQIAGGYGHRREPLTISSVQSIKHHAKRLKNRQKAEQARLGDEMSRMIEGETVADDPMTWRSALTRIAQDLARTFNNDKKERIAAFFKPSLSAMEATGNPVPKIEEIEAWIGAYAEGEKKRREEQAIRNADTLKNNIRVATGGARENKYTQDELDTWKETVGFDESRWILVNGKVVYVFCNGTWIGPFNELEFQASGYRALEAGAAFIRFKSYSEEKESVSYVPLQQLVQRYGSKVEVRVDFSCEKAWYRAEDNTLVLEGPQKAPLSPKFHVEVDQWFRVLTGRAEPIDEPTRLLEASKDRTAKVVTRSKPKPPPPPPPREIKSATPEEVAARVSATASPLANRFKGAFAAAAVAAATVTAPAPPVSNLAARFAHKAADLAADAQARAQAQAEKEPDEVIPADTNTYEWSSDLEEDDYDTLCNWCASFLASDRPCSALFLEGPHSVGKGLFSDGLARIYRGGKISIEAALSHFNALLLTTPYVHVDEGLPKGMTASVLLRRDLARDEHEYTRKNRDSGKIDGCIRLLFTANNLDVFNKDGELLKKDDVDAFGQRFVHIQCRPEAAAFLKKMGRRHHDFVKLNMIAEHVLWLVKKRYNAVQQRDLRFLVHGRTDKVSNVVATNSESTSDVCTWLCEAILNQQKLDWYAVRNGSLYVSSVGLHRHMQIHDPRNRHNSREITRAVSSISHGRSRSVRSMAGKDVRMWPFRLDALRAWCENALVHEWDDVVAALSRLNKDDDPPPPPPPSSPPPSSTPPSGGGGGGPGSEATATSAAPSTGPAPGEVVHELATWSRLAADRGSDGPVYEPTSLYGFVLLAYAAKVDTSQPVEPMVEPPAPPPPMPVEEPVEDEDEDEDEYVNVVDVDFTTRRPFARRATNLVNFTEGRATGPPGTGPPRLRAA